MNKELHRSLVSESRKAGGAHLTLQARDQTYVDFCEAMAASNVQIRSAAQIGGRELRLYATHLLSATKSVGTRQNRMSALRVVLAHSGKSSLAKDPNFSNAALGLGKRCRDGTKTAAEPITVEKAKKTFIRLRREWIPVVMELEEALGLRGAESVCVPAFRLEKWIKELQKQEFIQLVEATKGGRPRIVTPPDVPRAIAAVRTALAMAKANGGYLAQRKDGSPAKSKKSALSIYASCMSRQRIQGHSLRYAFARECVNRALDDGMTEKQALATTSRSLGHGDGRGRYVKQVYLK